MDLIQRVIRDSILRGEIQRTAGIALRETEITVTPSDVAVDASKKAPRFVLSTEGVATDMHIVRQFWDLSRAAPDGPGIPVGYGHDFEEPDLFGTWTDLAVEADGDRRRLVGTPALDVEDPDAMRLLGKIQRNILRSVSVGWIPGECIRRGELDPEDPFHVEPIDDECGLPAEGYVMGSAEKPNVLIECSLTPIPADAGAVALGRVARATSTVGRLARGERVASRDVDLAGALLALRDAPAVRTFIRTLIAEELSRGSAPPSRNNRFSRGM